MIHTRIDHVLLVQRIADRMFWAPDEGWSTTTPVWTEDATIAKRYKVFEDWEMRNPLWCNENSQRMRDWLEGTQFVYAKIETTAETEETL